MDFPNNLPKFGRSKLMVSFACASRMKNYTPSELENIKINSSSSINSMLLYLSRQQLLTAICTMQLSPAGKILFESNKLKLNTVLTCFLYLPCLIFHERRIRKYPTRFHFKDHSLDHLRQLTLISYK